MDYKRITAVVGGAESNRSTIGLAFAVGKQFGAHVDALHVRADPRQAIPYMGEGMSGAMVERRDQVLMTFLSPLELSATTLSCRCLSMKKPFFSERDISAPRLYFLFRRRTIIASVRLLLRVL